MITPDEFKRSWEANGDSLKLFPKSAFEGIVIPAEAVSFLSNVGLPIDAAPFLTFKAPKSGALQSVAKVWGADSKFEHHYIIGLNGSGDPIAITAAGLVVYLNHDLKFTEIYINKDIFSLAESLLRCRQLIENTQKIGGADAFLDGQIPPGLKAQFIEYLREADSRALDNGAMWKEEISTWTV